MILGLTNWHLWGLSEPSKTIRLQGPVLGWCPRTQSVSEQVSLWNDLKHIECKRLGSWSQRKTEISFFVVLATESE